MRQARLRAPERNRVLPRGASAFTKPAATNRTQKTQTASRNTKRTRDHIPRRERKGTKRETPRSHREFVPSAPRFSPIRHGAVWAVRMLERYS